MRADMAPQQLLQLLLTSTQGPVLLESFGPTLARWADSWQLLHLAGAMCPRARVRP
jgi:hypothetical protein